ncbi:hypothetical protein [Streptomyces sp. SBT349]|uniref:hypothetical protein n=1 Tax=Streptomyces sp. SBT349 TaxID=1580539 RepID=UPI00066AF2F3|nr:hypothetical protein [Streptomyces sp. SBT349]
MAFPQDRLPLRAELAFGADPAGDPAEWTWSDVAPDVHRQTITIRRGRSDEAGQPSPTSTSLQLDNPHGDYTPGNALGAHYPHVRQGVPARIGVQAGGPYLRVPDAVGARAVAASPPAVTGDLDVRVEVALDRLPSQATASVLDAPPWRHYAQSLIGRYSAVDLGRGWRMYLGAWGNVLLAWSSNGLLSGLSEYFAEDTVPYASGQRCAIRATLDADNGDGGHEVRFYCGPSLDGPWRQLGAPRTGSGTASIYQPAGVPLTLGDVQAQLARPAGRWYRAEVRTTIDGTVVASPDFTTLAVGDTAFTDATGIDWALSGGSEVTDWRTRMAGTVDEWAPTWPWGDLSDPTAPEERPGEARVDIAVSGILRRLGQGQKALQSTLRRGIPLAIDSGLLGYWPCEDGSAATSIASAIPGRRAAAVEGLTMAADSGLPSSAPLPQVGSDGGSFRVSLPSLPDASLGWRAEMVYHLDELPSSSLGWFRVWTSGGGVARITGYIGAGEIRLRLHDADGTVVDETFWTDADALAAATAGWCRVRLIAQPSGADWDYRLRWTAIGQDETWSIGVTHSGYTRPVRIDNQWSAGMSGLPFGHITYSGDPTLDPYRPGTRGPEAAYAGEYALDRMRRLAEEEQLPISVLGNAHESPQMGPQGQATLLTLLQECAAADGGVLSERREALGLQYRARATLYNQPPALVLDAGVSEIDNPFAPVLDDQRLRNDITVTRQGGSSARAVDEASVAELGLYDDSVTLNVAADDTLPGIAGWRLHRGTWPGMRYPAVTTSLDVAPQTIATWLDRAEGDRLQVVNLPPQHPTTAVDLMAEGYSETITPTRWRIEANASPGGIWTVGEVGNADPADDTAPNHLDTDGSSLYAPASADADTMFLWRDAGPPWETTEGPTGGTSSGDDLPVDLMVGGEVVTATALEPLAWDAFDRTVASGWGATTTGYAWVTSGGSASDRSVDGTAGIVTLASSPTTQRFQLVGSVTLTDCEVLVSVTPSQLATGGAFQPGIVLRVGAAYYRCRLVLATSGAVSMEVLRSTSLVGATAATPYTYGAGTRLWMRVRVDGHRVRGRVWPSTRLEPGGWWIDRTVVADPIASGVAGVSVSTAAGNTNVAPAFSFRDWQVVNPQYAEVTRSTNGVIKAHATGADVRLAHPMIIAL